jgi:hypothetical protein
MYDAAPLSLISNPSTVAWEKNGLLHSAFFSFPLEVEFQTAVSSLDDDKENLRLFQVVKGRNGQLYSIWWSGMPEFTHRSLAADLDASFKSLNPVRHVLGNAPSRPLQAQVTSSRWSTNTRRITRMQFENNVVRVLTGFIFAISGEE